MRQVLEWEGTYGYGDIAGAIANAIRYDKDLVLNWHKDQKFFPPHQKYHENDPESVLDRTHFIIDQFDGDVLVTHNIKNKREYRFKGREDEFKWYGTIAPTVKQPEVTDTVVVWHPLNNKDKLHMNWGTQYKDTLDSKKWSTLFSLLEDENVVQVSYRDPIEYVFESIRKAKLCIGYEGIGQVIAKNFWKPLITFSDFEMLSKITGGPWSHVTPRLDNSVMDINETIEKQLELIDAYRSSGY